MSMQEKLAAIAMIYARNEQEQGERYAKRELRNMLNDLSNNILTELQAERESVHG